MKIIIAFLARFHRKNWRLSRWAYPQLWDCWGDWNHGSVGRKRIERTCRAITGHEISRTEWGWDGGPFVDRHCRWCDCVIRVPASEEDAPDGVKNLMQSMGYDGTLPGIK